MRIHAFIVAWNEARVLPFTLDHYSKFCEKIFVYDNMSTDNSDEIYEIYDNVEVIKWVTPDKKYNDMTLANMKSNIYKQSKGKADWVIVCDCDELLYHVNLIQKLEEYDKEGITMPKIDGHDMCSEDFPIYDGEPITDKIKVGSDTYAPMCKNIIFKPSLDIKYMAGAHSNHTPNAKFSKDAEIKLLHYKFLGKEYVLARYNQLAEQLSDYNLKTGLSGHWTRPPMDYMDLMIKNQNKVIN